MNLAPRLRTNQEHTPPRKRILLIDGDHPVREALQRALTLENYEVTPAATSREAIRWFAQGAVDLVVLDLNLPNESGWDVYRRVTTTAPNLPVIATTARGSFGGPSVEQHGITVLEKPLNLPLLLSTMQRLAADYLEGQEANQSTKEMEKEETRE